MQHETSDTQTRHWPPQRLRSAVGYAMVSLLLGSIIPGCNGAPADDLEAPNSNDMGSERGECYPNLSCDSGLSCLSNVCVFSADDLTLNQGGTGGQGSGGAAGSVAQGGSAGVGGTNSQGGPEGMAGAGGTITTGTAGAGGSEESPVDETTDTAVLDNFSSCDGVLTRVAGRDGSWYSFGDDDVNLAPTGDVGAGTTPSGFNNPGECAAYFTSGCATAATDCGFAGMGFTLRDDEGPVDLDAFNGLTVQYRGDETWVVIQMTQARSFGVTLPSSSDALATANIAFADLVPTGSTSAGSPDLSEVLRIEFTSKTPSASGLAVWDIRLY